MAQIFTPSFRGAVSSAKRSFAGGDFDGAVGLLVDGMRAVSPDPELIKRFCSVYGIDRSKGLDAVVATLNKVANSRVVFLGALVEMYRSFTQLGYTPRRIARADEVSW